MNCSSISITLQSIDPNKELALWGLAEQYNTVFCDWSYMMGRLMLLQDFNKNLTNPLYQAELMQQKLDEIFYPVCYAYSILRIFMVCSVIVYVHQKMQEIMASTPARRSLSEESAHSINQVKKSQSEEKKFPQEKELEITVYRYVIYLSMALELICALRDFVLFRGMLLYTNVMDDEQITCYVDFYSDNFTCLNYSEVYTSWRPFNYTRQECNCLYHEPIMYSENDEGSYMTFSIIIWIITECLTLGAVGFSILTLSRINRREKSGWAFLKPTLVKIVVITLFCLVFYSTLIYYFNMPIYYRFYDRSVVVFYFFWKILGFILVFDRLYSKIWLELKLRVQSLHSHGIEWREYLGKLKRMMLRQHDRHHQYPEAEMQAFYDKNKLELQTTYDASLTNYYSENVEPYITKYEKEVNMKLKTKWYDYLNYMLLMDLIGIVGFSFLVFYSIQDNSDNTLFWIGFTLALVELIVFEISNIVFQLHCFFIELYKQLEEACNNESSLQSSEFQE